MPERKGATLAVRLLAVVLALVIWLFVAGQRPVQRNITVPLRVDSLPAGMVAAEPLPDTVLVTVRGPGLQMVLPQSVELALTVDRADGGAGAPETLDLKRFLRLPEHVHFIRMTPDRLVMRRGKVE